MVPKSLHLLRMPQHERMKTAREARGLSVLEASILLDVTKQAIYGWESAEGTSPHALRRSAIASTYRTTESALFGESSEGES